MEQIQFNCVVNTGTVSQSVISQFDENADLFSGMLKAQKSLATDQKHGSQGEECKSGEATKAKEDKTDEAINQQPPLLTDWFVPIVQGKSMGPHGAEITDMNDVSTVEKAVRDLPVETEGGTVNQVDVGFPHSGGSFPEMNSAKENGGQVANNRPVPVGQMPSLGTDSAFVVQSESLVQAGGFTRESSLSTDHSQNVAVVLSEVANGSKEVQRLRVVNQPVSVSAEGNALKPSVQPASGTVSEVAWAGISEQKTAVVQTATVAQTAEAFDRTDMPGSPKNTLQAETLQPSKPGSQTQMVTQDQNAEQTKIQNTVCTEVLTYPQDTEQVKMTDQSLSADYIGSQNAVRTEVLGQTTQTFEQVKSTVQTQNAVRNQVVYQINSHFDKGQQKFEMQLYPEDLGKVNVKMKVENSNLIVEISAASTKAQSIILANADDIKAILQSQMNRDVQIAIPQDQKLMQQSYNEEQSGHQNPYSSDDQQSEEKEEQQEMDTDNFLNTLNMFGKKYFTERSREYGG